MTTNVKPIPSGFHTVTPYLCMRDAAKAIEFYKKAFGAQEHFRMPTPDGKIMHAQIQIGDSIIMLSDEMPARDHLGPETRGGPTSSLMLYIDNVDAAFDKAVKAGCTVKLPLTNQFWGDRYGQLADPFGHMWSLATHVEDVPAEEMAKRSQEACKTAAAAAKN